MAQAPRGKYVFDDVYDAPDPRPYFRTLMEYDYRIPQQAKPLLRRLAEARRARTGRRPTVTDLCCSYGINAAMLKHDLTLDDLYSRYGSNDLQEISSEELGERDAAFFAQHRLPGAPRVLGLDVAANAVAYARRAGLLDDGWSENLERDEPSGVLTSGIRDTDLVTVTGGVGYIGPRTFSAVLSAVARPDPWVAMFVLRWVDVRPVVEVLAHHGLETEQLGARTFPQREFAGAAERDHVLAALSEQGVDPAGKELEGAHHADFYLARPKDDVAVLPLEAWFADDPAMRG
ncbi:MAG: hypothetical protein WD080_10925 [Egibacteraceae bacterium]